MAIATFDTLKYFNTLKAAGVPEPQAEAQTNVLAEALSVNFKDLVTKDDLKQAIDLLRSDMNGKFDGQILFLKWMVGLCLASFATILFL